VITQAAITHAHEKMKPCVLIVELEQHTLIQKNANPHVKYVSMLAPLTSQELILMVREKLPSSVTCAKTELKGQPASNFVR
jgi:hypothetical protein